MIERNEIEKADRTQTKGEALGVLAEMNGMLRKMPISEAVKKERDVLRARYGAKVTMPEPKSADKAPAAKPAK